VLCVVLLFSYSAMSELLCSDSAMCGVVMFLQCYVRSCYVLTVLCAVLCFYSAVCGVVMF